MRKRGKLLAGGAAVAVMAVCLISGPVLAGGDYMSPGPAGRTIWEGFHVGVHGGYGDSDYGISQRTPASPLTIINDDDDGFLGGFTYGTQWQSGNFVFGTDSVYSFGDQETGLSVAANGSTARTEINYSSETRFRAGVLVQPNVLVYGTLGLGIADVKAKGSLIAGGSDDDWMLGFAYGGGIETTMGNRWFARVEYIHIDYGDENFNEVGGGRFNVDLDTDIVRAAVGYRFDWSPWDLISGR
jgi:outer membrane immunogenic protein